MDAFTKKFWNEIIEEKEKHIFIDGKSYQLGSEKSKYKAFDGEEFKIELNAGEIITTTNLWCQGEIPNEFRGVLADTARFV